MCCIGFGAGRGADASARVVEGVARRGRVTALRDQAPAARAQAPPPPMPKLRWRNATTCSVRSGARLRGGHQRCGGRRRLSSRRWRRPSSRPSPSAPAPGVQCGDSAAGRSHDEATDVVLGWRLGGIASASGGEEEGEGRAELAPSTSPARPPTGFAMRCRKANERCVPRKPRCGPDSTAARAPLPTTWRKATRCWSTGSRSSRGQVIDQRSRCLMPTRPRSLTPACIDAARRRPDGCALR